MSTETVPLCPACRASDRTVAYDRVPDFVFAASHDTWSVVRCTACGSLYLPVRPDRADIGRHYNRYYTHVHAPDSAPISGINVQASGLKKLANSWRNRRYGTSRPSFGVAGTLAMLALPPLRAWIDAECRHLPPPRERHADFRVLDVGFGDGRFVRFAQEAGCRAVGYEIDPKSVAGARSAGLDVYQGDIDAALRDHGPGAFDYVTMSHVIEHVHDPRAVLATAARLLRPGGVLWVETPNPTSFGHQLFRDRWRDLDPPRHLCLMTRDALVDAARAAGLVPRQDRRRPFVPFEVFPFSEGAEATRRGVPASRAKALALALACELASVVNSGRREWLTLTFGKPAP